jgi:hypothetical protein
MEGLIPVLVGILTLVVLCYIGEAESPVVVWKKIGVVVVWGFALLMAYGLIRMIFRYGFDVELWNPFG